MLHQSPGPSVVIRTRRPVDRRPRPRRWHDAVAELIELQAAYAAWLEALPDTLRGTATAEALQVIVDLDLDVLAAIEHRAGMAATEFGRAHGTPMMLGEHNGLTQRRAVMPSRARWVRRDISNGEKMCLFKRGRTLATVARDLELTIDGHTNPRAMRKLAIDYEALALRIDQTEDDRAELAVRIEECRILLKVIRVRSHRAILTNLLHYLESKLMESVAPMG
jgi:hypothetical protein